MSATRSYTASVHSIVFPSFFFPLLTQIQAYFLWCLMENKLSYIIPLFVRVCACKTSSFRILIFFSNLLAVEVCVHVLVSVIPNTQKFSSSDFCWVFVSTKFNKYARLYVCVCMFSYLVSVCTFVIAFSWSIFYTLRMSHRRIWCVVAERKTTQRREAMINFTFECYFGIFLRLLYFEFHAARITATK